VTGWCGRTGDEADTSGCCSVSEMFLQAKQKPITMANKCAMIFMVLLRLMADEINAGSRCGNCSYWRVATISTSGSRLG